MPAPYRPVRTARRPTPITDEEYRALVDCRCSELPGTHAAGHCQALRETHSAAVPKQ